MAPPAVVTMSMSGAFEPMRRAAVVPRPARPSGVRASVSAKRLWVMLSNEIRRCLATTILATKARNHDRYRLIRFVLSRVRGKSFFVRCVLIYQHAKSLSRRRALRRVERAVTGIGMGHA